MSSAAAFEKLSEAQRTELRDIDCDALLLRTEGWQSGDSGVMYRSASSEHYTFYTFTDWRRVAASLLGEQRLRTVQSLIARCAGGQVVFCWQLPAGSSSEQLLDYLVAPVATATWLFTPSARRRSPRLRQHRRNATK